jgi:hypothetical protein
MLIAGGGGSEWDGCVNRRTELARVQVARTSSVKWVIYGRQSSANMTAPFRVSSLSLCGGANFRKCCVIDISSAETTMLNERCVMIGYQIQCYSSRYKFALSDSLLSVEGKSYTSLVVQVAHPYPSHMHTETPSRTPRNRRPT